MSAEDPSAASLPLLQRVARGEARAVECLLDRYRPLVWSIVRGKVPYDAAEDVVQEVFIQLWKSADRFDPASGTEATFISTIAHRRLIDRQRRDARRATEALEAEALPASPQGGEGLRNVELRDEAAWAEGALDHIRPEERAVLRMSISGLTHREIAEQTETPLGTVKSQARRGLERVRKLLKDSQDDTLGEELGDG